MASHPHGAGHASVPGHLRLDDPAARSAPFTAALDLKARPDDLGVFEYACYAGNYGKRYMLEASRLLDRK